MPRAALLTALAFGLLLLAGCWPATQSQTLTAAPTATAIATAPPTSPPKPTSPSATATAKPTAAVKPTAVPSPTTSSAAAKPSPTPNGATGASTSPPAIVATSVAGVPAALASPVPKPGDALGVAASANAAAAANTSDQEATALCGPGAILSTRAGQAAGRSATVAIGRVDASYQPNVRGQPTFLNDAPYPNHVFTAVIWGNNRRQFNPPPEGAWQGKALCVTGTVELFQQKPQIVVTAPSQLKAAR